MTDETKPNADDTKSAGVYDNYYVLHSGGKCTIGYGPPTSWTKSDQQQR